jgi:hypothetical protein
LGFTDANFTQFDGGEVGAEPVESVEAERVKKKNKYNLRKSIAWDSAFFTSAGLLSFPVLPSYHCPVWCDRMPFWCKQVF